MSCGGLAASARPESPQRNIDRRCMILCALAATWLCATVAGMNILFHYETTPADVAGAPARWPERSRLPRSPKHNALIMFAHPDCPCSRASIGELAEILARLDRPLTAAVVFFKPHDHGDHRLAGQDWASTELWRRAAEIPGVTVIADGDGRESSLFKASVSGQTLLYDPNGALRFNGGITISRGHSGDNAGRAAIIELVNTGYAPRTGAPAFGCALQNPAATVLLATPAWKKDEPK